MLTINTPAGEALVMSDAINAIVSGRHGGAAMQLCSAQSIQLSDDPSTVADELSHEIDFVEFMQTNGGRCWIDPESVCAIQPQPGRHNRASCTAIVMTGTGVVYVSDDAQTVASKLCLLNHS